MSRDVPALRTKFGDPEAFGDGTRLIKFLLTGLIMLGGIALLGNGVRTSEPFGSVWREYGSKIWPALTERPIASVPITFPNCGAKFPAF